jgi:hypothetical protein
MNLCLDANYQSNTLSSPHLTVIREARRATAVLALFNSKGCTKFTVALILWLSCGLAGVRLAAAQGVPTGTIELSGGSVAVGIGYTWGKGILIFEGKRYPIKVEGLSIVQVGVSSYTASGTVYDLTKLSNVNGIYTAASAGVAIAGGASATAMKNSHGVLIQMVSNHMGLNFSLAPKGVKIELQ